jgi:hypothetical protein
MARVLLAFPLFLLLLSAAARSAPVVLDMEGPPIQPPNTSFAINQYFEEGFHLRPFGPIDTTPPFRLGRTGPGGSAFLPQNGGTYLQLGNSSSLVVSKTDGTPFDVLRVDLAEYSTVFPFPAQIGFRGFQANNSFADVFFTTDGIIDGAGSLPDFQTFTFPSSFSRIVRLESLTTTYSLDNLVVDPTSVIPEPSTVFVGISLVSLVACRRRPGSAPHRK